MKIGRHWLILGGLLSATLSAAAWIRNIPENADLEIMSEVQTSARRGQPLLGSSPSPVPGQVNIEKLRSRSLGESTNDPFAMEIPPHIEFDRASEAARPAQAAPLLAPAAPPLPFTYVGKLLSGPEAKVFLTLGDRNLVLREGDTVDSIYRVDKIAEGAITLVYLPLAQRQTIVTGDSP